MGETMTAGDGRLVRVVVGVDGSDGGAAALDWAIREVDDEGEIVAVCGLASPAAQGLPEEAVHWSEVREARRAELSGRWTDAVRAAGRAHRVVLVEEPPADAVLRTARAESADAVVVGSHGHTRWAPMHLGGVTAKVLHRSDRPVVVVPPAVGPGARLVVGVNGSDASQDALVWAMARAGVRGVAVEAVWVVERLYADALHHAFADVDEDQAAAREALSFVVERAREAAGYGGPVTSSVVSGDASQILLDASHDAGAIVVGTIRLGPVAEFVTGSAFRRIASTAACPVVSVPQTRSR